MKLSKLYSNQYEKLAPIEFRDGLNVIFAEIHKPKDKSKATHNLGKTLLTRLIDFMLLKGVQKKHFLKKHFDLFKNFEFYLEIKLSDQQFLTIRRCASTDTKICFKKHNQPFQDFTSLDEEDWDHKDIPFEKAIALLDSFLSLSSIQGWSYRKGVSYFLRTQEDYMDVFQILKYSKGKHNEWKPYMAKVLGLDSDLVSSKYELDEKIEQRSQVKQLEKSKLINQEEDFDKIRGRIEITKSDISHNEKQLDSFSFYQQEDSLNIELVEKIEAEISITNNELYNIRYDLQEIEESLQVKSNFNLKEIKQLFEETKIHFPENLEKKYEELLDFHKKLTKDRRKYLEQQKKNLFGQQTDLSKKLQNLDAERKSILEVLQGADSQKKYKLLQKRLDGERASIIVLEKQLENLESIRKLDKEINDIKKERDAVGEKTLDMIHVGSEIYHNIRITFNEILKEVLGLPAILSVNLNQEKNIDFLAEISKSEDNLSPTSESFGHTYKKLLCAAFDLAVLASYSDKEFFKFVYHDGILESLDNRKKINFLNLIRQYCEKYQIQYMISVIDSDLPRDLEDHQIKFSDEEIVLKLHDDGASGRLFRMEKF